ncbi:cytochrome C assembly protein [Lysinibacillus sp. BF-4]|uniref:cytochrome c biogenesis protein CcsA n=1 Tax=Lysinibacillus sp. BF-4 TaxID=1473546 RepID=UPI000505F2FD|nr:cytochrome c biogenesis protein CcsA [Lysinibacillus sp. BF-4]KFL44111.1 cytochrome C assembly protein [Lysinibacillus sp. BF-4]
MTDLVMVRLYELMIVIYAISLVFYFVDYFVKRPHLRRIAFWLVSIVWALQSLYLLLYIIEMQRFPILSLYEGILFYSWLLVSLSIILHCIVRVDLPVLVIYSLGFVFVTIHTFMPKRVTSMVHDNLISEMLFIHIFSAIVAYAIFTLSFVFSVLYLLMYKMLKEKRTTPIFWQRFPPLEQMMNWMSVSLYIGVPILLISLLLGLEWAILRIASVPLFDPKIIASFLIVLMYSVIIYANRKGKLSSTKYAWVLIGAYIIVVINFFLVSSLSTFHLWY